MRFMDQQKLTMATLGGHGFGAKVALATATANLNRCTGIVALDGDSLAEVIDGYFVNSEQLPTRMPGRLRLGVVPARVQ